MISDKGKLSELLNEFYVDEEFYAKNARPLEDSIKKTIKISPDETLLTLEKKILKEFKIVFFNRDHLPRNLPYLGKDKENICISNSTTMLVMVYDNQQEKIFYLDFRGLFEKELNSIKTLSKDSEIKIRPIDLKNLYYPDVKLDSTIISKTIVSLNADYFIFLDNLLSRMRLICNPKYRMTPEVIRNITLNLFLLGICDQEDLNLKEDSPELFSFLKNKIDLVSSILLKDKLRIHQGYYTKGNKPLEIIFDLNEDYRYLTKDYLGIKDIALMASILWDISLHTQKNDKLETLVNYLKDYKNDIKTFKAAMEKKHIG